MSQKPTIDNQSMTNKKPLLLVMDGHAMVYRAWFAMQSARPMSVRSSGEDVRGVYSFTTTFFKFLANLNPTHVCITFDPPGRTFRDDLYQEYKANRPPMPDPLKLNIERAKQVMRAFDIPIFEIPGYEADDVLGTIAEFANQKGIETIIATGDTDTLQLVSEHVRVLLTTGFAESKIYRPAEVRARYDGLSPDQVRDVKALTGDTSDNIPGVPGIGIKTAVKLTQQFGNVESLLDNLDHVSPPRIQNLLRQHAKLLQESKVLVTIVRDVPMDFVFQEAQFGTFDRDSVLSVFQELQFSSLVDRIPRTQQPSSDESNPGETADDQKVQAPHSLMTVVDNTERLDLFLDELARAERVELEVYGNSPRAMEAKLVGIACAINGTIYYIPLGHIEGQQLTATETVKQFQTVIEGPNTLIQGHNLNFSLTLLANYGINPTRTTIGFDTAIAAHLLGEKSLGLKQLCFNRLNMEIQSLVDLTGSGRKQIGFDSLPISEAADFAVANLNAVHGLVSILSKDLERDALTEFNRDHAMPMVPVLARMQANGIALDTAVLAELNEDLAIRITATETAAYQAVGHTFAINSPSQLGELLFEELRLPTGKRTKTGYSTDASILENLRDAHPVVSQILDYRAMTKLKSTYAETLPREVNPATSRIHTTYNQAGSATGRLASNDPNLQNIPIRTTMGLRVRSAFIAQDRPGSILLSADYSQIDLRALAHLSKDPALLRAFERDEDVHASTASLIYAVPLGEVTAEMRRLAKVMNFGVAYGLSAFGISRQTEMTVDQGGQFIKDYFGTYPLVREYLDDTVARAKATGYAETLLGRRRYLPELDSPIYPVRQAGERMALNMPVQGTSSDIINAAMVLVQRRLEQDSFTAKMLLQVHDELVFELPIEEQEALENLLQEIMPNALHLDVPLKIDLKAGENWAQMVPIEPHEH